MRRIVLLAIFSVTLSTSFGFSQDAPPPVPPAPDRVQPPEIGQRQFHSTGRTGSRLTFGHLAESPGLHVTQDIFSLLQYERIHRALKLSRDQMAKIAETEIKNIRSRQEMMRKFSSSEGPVQTPESAKARREAQEEWYALCERRFQEILTREQLTRLSQIALELRIQSSGIYAILSDPQMVAELELPDAKLAELLQRTSEQSMEFDKKMMEFKREVRREITSVLDESQRLKLRSMLGKPFQWQEKTED